VKNTSEEIEKINRFAKKLIKEEKIKRKVMAGF
jgi:hypothetical protein